MPRRKILVLTAAIVLVALLAATLWWALLGAPPPALMLEYGLPPAGGPTGRTLHVEGMEFVELSRGYYLMGSGELCAGISRKLVALEAEQPSHWVEIVSPFWVSTTEVPVSLWLEFDQSGRYEEYRELATKYPTVLTRPAVDITWNDAKAFCRWMSGRHP